MLISYQDWQILNNFRPDELKIDETILNSLKNIISPKNLIQKIKMHYEKLKNKYGDTWAKLIIVVALLGTLSPIPGSSIIAALPFVGLAEVFKWIKSNPEKEKEINDKFGNEKNEIINDLQSA